ncbi:MAG: glycosyltransferase, partial [Arenimonas sp.]
RFNYVREVDYVSGAVLSIRKEVFDEMHGFDTHFAPGYFEDTDLAMRVRASGLKIRYQAFARVVHLEGATSGTRLDSGMKAFQVPHQIKFAERWQKTLIDYPLRPGTKEENKTLAFKSDRKKVLIMDEHTPRTNADSGSLRLFHLMQCLQGENYDLHFMPADLSFDSEHTAQLQQQGIACYYRPWTKNVFDWIKKNASQFDLIIVCRVDLMASIYDTLRKTAPTARLIFDTVDLHHVREAQEAELSNSVTLKKQAHATKEKEYALIEKCDETWVVSQTEYLALETAFPGKNIRRVSNIHKLRLNTPCFANRNNVLFVGNFRHPPNADGLQWFLEAVWPKVHSERPDIVLEIAGNSAPEYLESISKDMNIVFLGHVSDIDKLIDGKRINVAPLRYGAGAKGKISHALASGLPTIATTVAADGMLLTPGKSVLIADDAETFAKAILALYEDETFWNFLSKNGHEVAKAYFSEQAAGKEIRKMFS